ncbi:MAG TPA: radical SAM family heme chaperone HemW [Clostridia bacterium]|nr:radical SAM family heme chaperone HemW [Clostridia bacterium]
MSLGLYISVPFCRTKCSFCNFASGVFSRELFNGYIRHVTAEIERADQLAAQMGGEFERAVDSVYLGGGTPSVLELQQLSALFVSIRSNFEVAADAEVTVECAPGTLKPELVETLVGCGVNRVSLGVQSFVDQESRAVGRLHTRVATIEDIAQLRAAGIADISVDLIAGLPHQTEESWRYSLQELIATGVPHASVYMLEVDEDSRLGRELMAGGTRYHAHFVPDEEATADFYVQACEALDAAGVRQYEISNFAREGKESRHNLKYWLHQPYMGFGVDAHSMLCAPKAGAPHAAVRFATSDSLDAALGGAARTRTDVSERNAIEEAYFLGLRLTRGVELARIAEEFGVDAIERYRDAILELNEAGLLEIVEGFLRLTSRGRLLSNEVFERFLYAETEPEVHSFETQNDSKSHRS